MALTDNNSLVSLYRSRAKLYDFIASIYPYIGFRQNAYRKLAIRAMRLHPGDIVVDVGCGTGLNFSLMQQAIGPTGKIIGVDITDAMLDCARQRIAAERWANVELVQTDVADFTFPFGLSGIISTFALTLVPEFDIVLYHGSAALLPGKRWVVLDFRLPDNRLAWLAPFLERILTRPFGGPLDMAGRHPWISMQKYLENVTLADLFFGFAYVVCGEKKSGDRHE